MKGKIAFVAGLAAGYVLGSRAGRERYEQIKSGFNTLMETAPVQKYRASVRGFVDDKVTDGKNFVSTKTRQALFFMTKPEEDR